ncbi:Oidioi.mRNA.OKI2018_I69.chr2.g7633.t1.cds [Oikopleura dioica]|uniref:Oidioi.mRNA.OKI2018_I69.chr2.g7633.t1.cds n=1 Tax=Oikopleura dioica TaxID=34765 RepID=A0ABN7T961_OIKDI|nr:Oidioi.mRNA.OKI2018_I69.chr2.g7633.t1.cds [Oikopleura dioica]
MVRSRSRSRSRERDTKSKPFHSSNPRSKVTNDFLDVRGKMRNSIFENGTDKAWGRSPSPISSDSDIEEHVKRRQKRKQYEAERQQAKKAALESQKVTISSDSDDDEKSKKSKKKKKKKDKKAKKEKKKKRSKVEYEDMWVENTGPSTDLVPIKKPRVESSLSIGPELPEAIKAAFETNMATKQAKPGQGVQLAEIIDEQSRIPRRGEVGHSEADIDHYENAGYIMSGNRHRRMEAVRLKKESQIYSVEEKRALQIYTRQERENKETAVIQQFKDMVNQRTLETKRKNAMNND